MNKEKESLLFRILNNRHIKPIARWITPRLLTALMAVQPASAGSISPNNKDSDSQPALKEHKMNTNPHAGLVSELPADTITSKTASDSISQVQLQSPLHTAWQIVWNRETAHNLNPIGAISSNGLYYGAMQGNRLNATNTMHYGLLLGGKYKEFVLKFYNAKLPGFEKALKNLEKSYCEKGCLVFANASKERIAIDRYISPTFKSKYKTEGLGKDKELFLDLQKKYFNSVWTNFPGILKPTISELNKQNIEITDVDPAILGMWLEHCIAKGNGTIIPQTLKNIKSKGGIKYINSAKYVRYFDKFSYIDKKGKKQRTICDNPDFIIKNLGKHNLQTAKDLAEILNPTKDVMLNLQPNYADNQTASPTTSNLKKQLQNPQKISMVYKTKTTDR